MSTIKSILFPNKTFASKEVLFAALKENENFLIDAKKSAIQLGFTKSACFGNLPLNATFESVEKGQNIGFRAKEGYIYPIISTCNYFDTHKDVHVTNSMNKTAKEQQGKVYYCADHNLSTSGTIATKSDVGMMIKTIPWSLVGKDYEGSTQALIFEIAKENIIHEKAKTIIEKESDLENSIRMRYVSVKMAINSDGKDYKENKVTWDAYIEQIVNKDEVLNEGYFFAVTELQIVGEGSLVINGGSNDATAIYQPMKEEAVIDTSTKIEPPIGTQNDLVKIYSQIKF